LNAVNPVQTCAPLSLELAVLSRRRPYLSAILKTSFGGEYACARFEKEANYRSGPDARKSRRDRGNMQQTRMAFHRWDRAPQT